MLPGRMIRENLGPIEFLTALGGAHHGPGAGPSLINCDESSIPDPAAGTKRMSKLVCVKGHKSAQEKGMNMSGRLLAAVLICCATSAWGQSGGAAELSESQAEALHQELRELRATMERALNERDLDSIVANVTDDVLFTTMNGDVVRGPDAIREYFEKMLSGPDAVVETVTSSFEADDLSLLVEDDVAIAFGHSKDQYVLTNGMDFEVSARWSATMIRRDERWLIANFHYSTNMFDNPVLDAQRATLIKGFLAVGAVLLIAGFFIGRASRRSARS